MTRIVTREELPAGNRTVELFRNASRQEVDILASLFFIPSHAVKLHKFPEAIITRMFVGDNRVFKSKATIDRYTGEMFIAVDHGDLSHATTANFICFKSCGTNPVLMPWELVSYKVNGEYISNELLRAIVKLNVTIRASSMIDGVEMVYGGSTHHYCSMERLLEAVIRITENEVRNV